MEDKKFPETTGANRGPDGRFPPGISGNLAGRPKGRSIVDIIKAKLDEHPIDKETGKPTKETYAEIIAIILLGKAASKDIMAIKEILDRVEGKPAQKINLGREGMDESIAKLGEVLNPPKPVEPPPSEEAKPNG